MQLLDLVLFNVASLAAVRKYTFERRKGIHQKGGWAAVTLRRGTRGTNRAHETAWTVEAPAFGHILLLSVHQVPTPKEIMLKFTSWVHGFLCDQNRTRMGNSQWNHIEIQKLGTWIFMW